MLYRSRSSIGSSRPDKSKDSAGRCRKEAFSLREAKNGANPQLKILKIKGGQRRLRINESKKNYLEIYISRNAQFGKHKNTCC
jgi:hypothetical protein